MHMAYAYWPSRRYDQPYYETRLVTRICRAIFPFDLLVLHDDVITKILPRVCEWDMQDLRHSKIVCKALKEKTETQEFFNSVNLTQMAYNVWAPGFDWKKFNESCYDADNTSAIIFKGISYFFFNNKRDEGLARIQAAAKDGCILSKYVYGCIRKVFGEDRDDELFDRYEFTREDATQLRLKLPRLDHSSWGGWLPDWFKAKRDENSIDHVRHCICSIFDPWGSGWPLFKDYCDQCFWIMQTAFFCRLIDNNFSRFPCNR